MRSLGKYVIVAITALVITCGFSLGEQAHVLAQIVQVSGAADLRIEGALPGSSFVRSVTITNAGDVPQGVRAYLMDEAFMEADGSGYRDPGSLSRSVAPWVTFDEPMFTLEPGEARELRFQINVPVSTASSSNGSAESSESAGALNGTFWGVLMVEGVPPADRGLEDDEPNADSFRLSFQVRFRQAFNVSVTMADKGDSELHFLNPALRYDGALADDDAHEESATDSHPPVSLVVSVANRGEALTDPVTVSADLFDANGMPVGRATSEARRLMPGQAREFELSLGALAPGQYSAVVLADSGEGDVFGARYTLNVQAEVAD